MRHKDLMIDWMNDPKIEWEIGSMEDEAGDGHCFFHFAFGEDEFGNTYTGIAVMVDDELDEITDIEVNEKNNTNHEHTHSNNVFRYMR